MSKMNKKKRFGTKSYVIYIYIYITLVRLNSQSMNCMKKETKIPKKEEE